MRKMRIYIVSLLVLLSLSACSSNAQSSPDELLISIIKKATSGDLTEIYQVGSMVYTNGHRSDWLQDQIDGISKDINSSKFIKEEVTLRIGENPYLPQTDNYKQYVVLLPPEEGAKLIAKGVPSDDVRDLTDGVLVGLIYQGDKWFLDLSYKKMGSDSFKKSSPSNSEDEVDWIELKEEMVLPTN